MSKFIIQGPAKFAGEISVLGAKNAAMKMIAASILTKEEIVLKNVPNISDIDTIIKILEKNGTKFERQDHTLKINTTDLSSESPDYKLVEKMRGSIVLIGPYLARFGRISLPKPGGCSIGSRPIDIHLDAFKEMGAETSFAEHIFDINCPQLIGASINLRFASVTATENIIMAAILAKGTTIIENAAREPEIVDLANFLNSLGAKIKNAGSNTIEIEGVDRLHGGEYSVMPDRIEAGTFAALAVTANSPLKITNCRPSDIEAFLETLEKMGVQLERGKDFLYIKDSSNLKPIDIETEVFPGFPTDLQAPMGLVLTQANGQSRITENIFENRLSYLEELKKMGAKTEIINCHEAIINGPTKLHGAAIDSLDLRAGATLLLAGLVAEGETTISKAEIVDRGYENIEGRLKELGINIERIED